MVQPVQRPRGARRRTRPGPRVAGVVRLVAVAGALGYLVSGRLGQAQLTPVPAPVEVRATVVADLPISSGPEAPGTATIAATSPEGRPDPRATSAVWSPSPTRAAPAPASTAYCSYGFLYTVSSGRTTYDVTVTNVSGAAWPSWRADFTLTRTVPWTWTRSVTSTESGASVAVTPVPDEPLAAGASTRFSLGSASDDTGVGLMAFSVNGRSCLAP